MPFRRTRARSSISSAEPRNRSREHGLLAVQPMDGLTLIGLLDDLRAAYDRAKEDGNTPLQSRLMAARRALVALLQRNLNLQSEILDLQVIVASYRAAAQADAEIAKALLQPSAHPHGPH